MMMEWVMEKGSGGLGGWTEEVKVKEIIIIKMIQEEESESETELNIIMYRNKNLK